MSIIGTKQDFEALADFVLQDYLRNQGKHPQPVSIVDFAVNYLKMDLSYAEFADRTIAGMTYGRKIVIDIGLQAPDRIGERNFTIAHECGHELINQQDENYNPEHNLQYRKQKQRKQLRTNEDFEEWQANVVAASLLMPPELLDWAVFTFRRSKKLPVYGDYLMYKKDLYTVKNMMGFFGVSKTALLIRLNELGYVENKPLAEYDYAMDLFFERGVI